MRSLRPQASQLAYRSVQRHSLTLQSKRNYQELAQKPSDESKPFPWRSVRMKQGEKTPHPLHVAVYNPLGTSLRPPQPVLMLPGLTGNYRVFSQVCRHMDYPHGAIAMDFRGRGMSQVRSDDRPIVAHESLMEHVHDVMRVLRFFHLYNAFLVGYEFGGLIGILAARYFPERVSGVVLIDSGFVRTNMMPTNIVEGYKTELQNTEKSYESVDQYLEQWKQYALGKNTGANLSLDAREMLSLDLKKTKEPSSGAYAHRTNPQLARFDMERMIYDALSMEELFKVRHPVAMVRAQQGFTPNSPPVIDPKFARDLERTMSVKSDIVVENATHYTLMWEKEHAAKVAHAIDTLTARYDVQQQVLTEFLKLKDKPIDLSEATGGENEAGETKQEDKSTSAAETNKATTEDDKKSKKKKKNKEEESKQ